MGASDATSEHLEGVVFPLVDGARSSSATGRTVFAAAAAELDADLAREVETAPRWHRDYATVLRRLVEAEVASATDPDRVPRAGLDALRAQLRFLRDEDDVPLTGACDLPLRDEPATAEVRGEGEPARGHLAVPYRGDLLAGEVLRDRLERWVATGTVEPSFAAAIGRVMDEPDWLDLADHTFVVLGAGAQMGPLEALSRWGATVVPVDLPGRELWQRILAGIRAGTGRAIVPLHRDAADDGDLADRAGVDLVREFPELTAWLEGLPGPLTVGSYVYADGAMNVRVSMAADALVARLLERRRDVTLAGLLTPTDVYAAPEEVVQEAQERYLREGTVRRGARWLTGGRVYAPNYSSTVTASNGTRFGIADCLVQQQGPNYALAKRAQRWRLRLARHDGVRVSANIAPATATRSVLNNRVLASAYSGAHHFGVEIFEPETSATLEAALLVRDLHDPDSAGDPSHVLRHPLELFSDAAAHGGLWRQPYAPRSVLPVAAIRGLLRPRSRDPIGREAPG